MLVTATLIKPLKLTNETFRSLERKPPEPQFLEIAHLRFFAWLAIGQGLAILPRLRGSIPQSHSSV